MEFEDLDINQILPSSNVTPQDMNRAQIYNWLANRRNLERWQSGVQPAIDEYTQATQELARQQDEAQGNTNLLNAVGQAAAIAGGTKAVPLAGPSPEPFRAQREALLQQLEAKTRQPKSVMLPGLASQGSAKPIDEELDQLKKAYIKAQTENLRGQTAGTRPADQARTLADIGKQWDKETDAARTSMQGVKALRELANSNTPLSYEAIKSKLPKAAGDAGALSNQDRESYAGSKAILDQIEQFFSSRVVGEGMTPANKAMVDDLINRFEASSQQTLASAKDRYERRGQLRNVAPGITTEYIFGNKEGVWETKPSAPAPAPQTSAAAPQAPAAQPAPYGMRVTQGGKTFIWNGTKYEEKK